MARVQQVDAFRVDLPAGQEQGEPVPVRRQLQAVAVPAVAVAAAGLHVCVCGVPLVAERDVRPPEAWPGGEVAQMAAVIYGAGAVEVGFLDYVEG